MAFCDTSVVTLVGSVNLGDFNLKMRWSMTFPQSIRHFMFWGVSWGLNSIIWAEFMGVCAVSRHKDNPCLETFLNDKGKQQCAICLKQTHSYLGHLGGVQKHIPRTNTYLEGPKVAKMLVLLSCFLFFHRLQNSPHTTPFMNCLLPFSSWLAFACFPSALWMALWDCRDAVGSYKDPLWLGTTHCHLFQHLNDSEPLY